MPELIKYKLTFPVKTVDIAESYPYPLLKEEKGKAIIPAPAQIRVSDEELTFTINNIKSRTPSVGYFKFYGFDYRKNKILEYTSPRWVITTEYSQKYNTFNIKNLLQQTNKEPEDLDHFYIELYLLGIDSENPLYFNRLQLNDGELKDYHTPNEHINEIEIGFNENSFVNLYDSSDNFLQIIRPYHESFKTTELSTSQVTILAPHLENETSFDNPIALFYEYMYMSEQKIGVEK